MAQRSVIYQAPALFNPSKVFFISLSSFKLNCGVMFRVQKLISSLIQIWVWICFGISAIQSANYRPPSHQSLPPTTTKDILIRSVQIYRTPIRRPIERVSHARLRSGFVCSSNTNSTFIQIRLLLGQSSSVACLPPRRSEAQQAAGMNQKSQQCVPVSLFLL